MQNWSSHLANSLQDARTKLVHSGDKGDANEAAFRDFLRQNLPPKYRIGQGEVIDCGGGRSRQTDVVLADEEQPFSVSDTPQLMIIEGVAAAAEVKTSLSKQELLDCIEKGRAFKSLNAVLGRSVLLAASENGGIPNSDILRFYHRRPFFVFAYEGTVDQNVLHATLSAAEQEGQPPPIDAVFVLGEGFALNLWDGNGALSYKNTASGDMARGWIGATQPEMALVWLLFWLNSVMPRFAMRSSPMMAYLLPGTSWTPSVPLNTASAGTEGS